VITVNAVRCRECGDIIYSRARHDFHACGCGKSIIDGGFDYVKTMWSTPFGPPERLTIQVEATKRELLDDWDTGRDRYGRISANRETT
jgi:hypothetical protein